MNSREIGQSVVLRHGETTDISTQVSHTTPRTNFGGRPRTGTFFRRWRGNRIPIDSKLPAKIYWECEFFGERISLSTGTVDHARAVMWVDDYFAGLRHVTDKEQFWRGVEALGERAKRERNAFHVGAGSPDIDKTWPAFEESRKRPKTGPAALANYKAWWARFAKWLPHYCRRLSDVTPALAEQYVRELDTRGLKGGSVNKQIFVLRLIFRILQPDRPNPFSDIQSMLATEETPHRRLWPAELKKLYKAFRGDYRRLLVIGYTTGQRLADCAVLKWEQVRLTDLYIDFTPSKTRRKSNKRVIAPILPDLATILNKVPTAKRTGYVLPDLAAQYVKNRYFVSKHISAVFRKCKVNDTEDGTADFRSLRTTWQTLMDEGGVSRAISRSVTGHASTRQGDTYSDLEPTIVRKKVMAAVPRIAG